MRVVSLIIILGIGAVAGAAQAETPAPFQEFSAKRIGPPKPGTKKRITVQIDPAAKPPPKAPTAAKPKEGAPASPGRYASFWSKVSPALAQAGGGRLEPALLALQEYGGVPAPRLKTMHALSEEYGVELLRRTVGTRVSPALALAVMAVESGGRADAVSSAGAQGLMQLMPATATQYGVDDPLVPAENIAGGVRYLDWLMQEFSGDPILVLAGYNAGTGAVRKHDGVPPYAETRDYVPKVLAAYALARGLCQTPPQLISDGCVFVQTKTN